MSWTKYANWSGGELLFALDTKLESQIGDKVSPSLASAFGSRQLILSVNSPISIERGGSWILQDENGNHYEIRKENDKLNVYGIDILTCSRAVYDPEGRLAGVVGLDIGMDDISGKVIRTPGEFKGYAFLLNEQG